MNRMAEDAGHSILDVVTPEELEELRAFARRDKPAGEFLDSDVFSTLYGYYDADGDIPTAVKDEGGIIDVATWIMRRAIDDVAEFAGGFGLEEIGSSDVSGWVNEIIRSLEKSDDGMEEGNEFAGELAKARDAGDEEFTVGGKTYPVKEEDELTEWANDAGEKGTEQSFEQDIEFMTKVISGGLNKEKKDQTTLPHTKVKVDESESPSDWKKLAGIK